VRACVANRILLVLPPDQPRLLTRFFSCNVVHCSHCGAPPRRCGCNRRGSPYDVVYVGATSDCMMCVCVCMLTPPTCWIVAAGPLPNAPASGMKVGVVGLGNMGAGIAQNLIDAGNEVVVYDGACVTGCSHAQWVWKRA